jgi:PAB1-binding protein PBP1
MRNILTDNKSIKEMTNRQFVNHIFETSTAHEVILMKIIDDGIKATLSNKDKIFKEWEEASEETKKSFIDSLNCTVPGYFNYIKEIQTAYNLKYKL